jgi:hypothetical protein
MVHGAEFVGLGAFPEVDEMIVTGRSSDGSIAIGAGRVAGDAVIAWRWTAESGIEPLRCPDDRCWASGISADGSVIVGSAGGPVRWLNGSQVIDLEVPPANSNCTVAEVSGDGTVAVGYCYDPGTPVRWTESGVEALVLPDGYGGYPQKVSFDGSIIAIRARRDGGGEGPPLRPIDTRALLWREDSGCEDIGPGWFSDLTPDGTVAVGYSLGQHFRWTNETGMVTLPFESSLVLRTTADGSVLFGGDGEPNGAFVRFEDNRIRNVSELLISEYGLANELRWWELEFVEAISEDGRTIVGRGTNPKGESESWMAILDPAIQAGDADQDFDFDQLDLVQVQVAGKYLTGEPATWGEGDWNGTPVMFSAEPPVGDGVFNQFDIVTAQQAGLYLAGPYAAMRADMFLAVPEPSSLLLGSFAGFLFVLVRRNDRKAAHLGAGE